MNTIFLIFNLVVDGTWSSFMCLDPLFCNTTFEKHLNIKLNLHSFNCNTISNVRYNSDGLTVDQSQWLEKSLWIRKMATTILTKRNCNEKNGCSCWTQHRNWNWSMFNVQCSEQTEYLRSSAMELVRQRVLGFIGQQVCRKWAKIEKHDGNMVFIFKRKPTWKAKKKNECMKTNLLLSNSHTLTKIYAQPPLKFPLTHFCRPSGFCQPNIKYNEMQRFQV